MNKEQYLKSLKAELSSLSKNDIDDAIQYYSELFDDCPLSDEEKIKELGSPKDVATKIINESNEYNTDNPVEEKKKMSLPVLILIGAFVLFFGFPIITAVASALLGTYLIISVLFISGIIFIFSSIMLGYFSLFVGVLSLGVFLFSIALITFALGAFQLIASYYSFKFITKGLIDITKSIIRRFK